MKEGIFFKTDLTAPETPLILCDKLGKSEVTQSCPTLCDPMNYSPPGSSVHGILQGRKLEWVVMPFSRGSSWSRDWTRVSCIAGRCFIVWATKQAQEKNVKKKKKCICRIPETNTTLTIKYVVVQLTSHVWLFAIPWTVAHQASWSFTTYQSLLKLMSIELVMPCNHLIRHWPLLLPPSVFRSIRVFSNESAIYIRWLKDWSFN